MGGGAKEGRAVPLNTISKIIITKKGRKEEEKRFF